MTTRLLLTLLAGICFSAAPQVSAAAEPSGGVTGGCVSSVYSEQTWAGNSHPTLLAQSWRSQGNGRQQSNSPFGGVRAKTLIRMGLLIAGLIGGLIVFLVRLASNSSSASRQPMLPPHVSSADVSSGPAVGSLPGPQPQSGGRPLPAQLPAKPMPALAAHAPSPLGGIGLRMLMAAAFALVIIVGVFAARLVFMWPALAGTAETTTTDPPFSIEQFDEFRSRLESLRELERAQFEQRWEAVEAIKSDSGQNDAQLATELNDTVSPPRTFQTLKPPSAPISEVAWDDTDLVESGVSISRRGMSFHDLAPEGAVLVGLRVTSDRHRLQSIQPIYQQADQYVLGQVQGNESQEQMAQLLAQPGHAVTALRLDVGGRVEGLQVEFGRVSEGRIDPADKYVSSFFGRKIPNNAIVIEGQGDLFAGVAGKILDGFDELYLKRIMELDACTEVQPHLEMSTTTTLPRAGGTSANEFADSAPEGGFLVGMRFFLGRSWGGAIQGVQPIYQVGGEYQVGRRYGADGGLAHQELARPGYAVGAIDARAGLVLNSVQMTFQRVAEGKLDSTDS